MKATVHDPKNPKDRRNMVMPDITDSKLQRAWVKAQVNTRWPDFRDKTHGAYISTLKIKWDHEI